VTQEPLNQPVASGPTAPPAEDEHHESLARWFLSLTPQERLAVLTNYVKTLLRAHALPGLADLRGLLSELVRGRVQFVVIGGVAAALRGAPVTTLGLEIVPARDSGNAERLRQALAVLHAHYRGHPDVEPKTDDLQRPGHHLLITSAGPLDILGVAIGDRDSDKLLACSDLLPLDDDLEARVLRLDEIIAMKEHLGREKDLAALPMLRTALRLSRPSVHESRSES
jgi:hypothetical protein